MRTGDGMFNVKKTQYRLSWKQKLCNWCNLYYAMSLSLVGTPPLFAKQIVLQIIFIMMSWQYLCSSRQTNSFRGRNPNPKFWCNEVINRLSGPSQKLNALTFQRKSLLYSKDFCSTKAIQYIITFKTNAW